MPVSKSSSASYEETDPFFLWAEEYWISPCMAQMPKPLHGLCMYGPAFILMLMIVGLVAVLMYCENRGKAKSLAEAADAKTKPKKTPETKKTK